MVKSGLGIAVVVGLFVLVACGEDYVGPYSSPIPGCQAAYDNFKDTAALTTRSDGLAVGDFCSGTGTAAKSGSKLTVQYTGWLSNGTQFDSSRNGSQPFPFTLGAGQVIKGWDEGLAGMRVGGKRRLRIPPVLGYGPVGSPGKIPGNSTLIFDITLVDVQTPTPSPT